MTWIAVVAIAIGLLMIAQWALSLARGTVPELRTHPTEIRLHLVAEFVTAGTLIVGGSLALAGAAAASAVLLFGLGMLTYTAVVSPGYFLERHERAPVAMFAVIIVVALLSAAWLVLDLAV